MVVVKVVTIVRVRCSPKQWRYRLVAAIHRVRFSFLRLTFFALGLSPADSFSMAVFVFLAIVTVIEAGSRV